MKLDQVLIKNFRGYCDETPVEVADLTALIGRNDAGKSTILEALEIFFNNATVSCEREDLSIQASGKNIEITCTFSDVPSEVVIDSASPTSLVDEHLLTEQGQLKIKKIFSTTTIKPKEKIYVVCMHPAAEMCSDLLELKRTELRSRARELGVPDNSYNSNINASIRQAIRVRAGDLQLATTDLLIDKEDTKKFYDAVKGYLPIYALFQSDRQSRDDDKEVADPMKLAVQQALQDLSADLDKIKFQVRKKAIETASRTLLKLEELVPDLASELVPEFKSDPKFDSQFKLSIRSDDEISLNKRGSGVRRLILLSFFRAEAERRKNEKGLSNVIYAFEEPETSQHPDHQEILVRAFLELANTEGSQILLTTHTPALAGLLPLNSLRFIERDNHQRKVSFGSEEVFQKVADTLGVLPEPIPKGATAILLVEGPSDIVFVHHTAEMLKSGGYLAATLEERRIAVVPVGGCGSVKYWRTMQLARQFDLPYCVLLDSDCGTPMAEGQRARMTELRADGVRAYLTRKREPENYIHLGCLDLPADSEFAFTETCDAKYLIGKEVGVNRKIVLEKFWPRMTCAQIRDVEKYVENGTERYELTEMLSDFLLLSEHGT